MDQQFGGTKLKALTNQDIQSLDKQATANVETNLPPIPDENDPIVASRKAQQEREAMVKAQKGELEDKAINMHPVLKKLKKTLGINKIEIFEETVYVDEQAIKFGFTEYPEDLNIWCVSESRRMLNMGLEEEKVMKAFDILRLGCSLVSIEGCPSYEVYGIIPKDNELRNNAFDLSDRLRKAVAVEFHKFVTEEGRAFVDILEDFWQKKILLRANIKSASDKIIAGDSVFICEVAGCDFIHTGKEGPFYCVKHSAQMKKALTTKESDNLPLA